MKIFSRFLSTLILLALCRFGTADTLGNVSQQPLNWGASLPISATQTYALTSALTGTASSAIDLQYQPGIYISSTGTAGAGMLQAEWSSNNTAATRNVPFNLLVGRDYYLPKAARYLRIINPSTNISGATASAWYSFATTQSEGGYLDVPNFHYSALSTAATVVNLTTVAGTTSLKPLKWKMSSQSGDFYWDSGSSATAPSRLSHYQPVSTVAISEDRLAPGSIIYFKGATTTAETGITIGQQQ